MVVRRAAGDTWAFATVQGLLVAIVVAAISAVADVATGGNDAPHALVVALAAIGALCLLVLLLNLVLAPARLARESRDALAERDARLDELTRVRKPRLQISAGTGPEFQAVVQPGAEHIKTARELFGRAPKELHVTRLRVSELEGVEAGDVRVRITAADPPAPPGEGSYPVDLTWQAVGGPREVSIPPRGREYIRLHEVMVLTDSDPKGPSGTAWLPLPYWHDLSTVTVTLEVSAQHEVLDCRRFRIDDFMQKNPDGTPRAVSFPRITEVEG